VGTGFEVATGEPPSLVAGELGGGALGAVVVDQCLAIGSGADEGRSGVVVE